MWLTSASAKDTQHKLARMDCPPDNLVSLNDFPTTFEWAAENKHEKKYNKDIHTFALICVVHVHCSLPLFYWLYFGHEIKHSGLVASLFGVEQAVYFRWSFWSSRSTLLLDEFMMRKKSVEFFCIVMELYLGVDTECIFSTHTHTQKTPIHWNPSWQRQTSEFRQILHNMKHSTNLRCVSWMWIRCATNYH